MNSLFVSVLVGCVLACAQAHVSSGWGVVTEELVNMAETVAKNQDYLEVCSEHLGSHLENVAGCKNLTHDLSILAVDTLNSTVTLWNVTSDVIQIAKLLNNCTKESIFKRTECYAKATKKIISLFTAYLTRVISTIKVIVVDTKNVVADVTACFHHGYSSAMLEQQIQACKLELSLD